MKFYQHSVILVLLILAGVSCDTVPYELVDSYNYIQKEERQNVAGVTADWKLIWEDNFDSPAIDTGKWTRIHQGNPDWRKHMSTDDRCYDIRDGKLYLLGINNPDTVADKRPFLTGGVYTRGKFAFQYGKIEIHAKLECAQGAWPAMWMLAEQRKYGGYPRNGEIDIMEHLNFEDIVYHTTHSWYTLELGEKKNPPHHGTSEVDIDAYNTYGLEWYPDSLVFTLNGNRAFTYPRLEGVDPTQWPYDQPFYILVDQQLGGAWVGEINPDHLPVSMIVDYVRVYQ